MANCSRLNHAGGSEHYLELLGICSGILIWMSDKLQFVVVPAYVDKLKFVGQLIEMQLRACLFSGW